MAHGGTVISAWEVDDLPDEVIDACDALVNDLPSMKRGTAKIEEYMAKVRAEHPQYKHRKNRYKH